MSLARPEFVSRPRPHRSLVILLATACSLGVAVVPPPVSADTILQCTGGNASCRLLPLPLVGQKENIWCWAATTEMVFEYFGASSEEARQCQIATNRRDGKVPCCDEEFRALDRAKDFEDRECVDTGWPRFEDFEQKKGLDYESTMCRGLLGQVLEQSRNDPDGEWLSVASADMLEALLADEDFLRQIAKHRRSKHCLNELAAQNLATDKEVLKFRSGDFKADLKEGESYSLPWATLVAEIDAGRPLAASWRYSGPGSPGHIAAVAGYVSFPAAQLQLPETATDHSGHWVLVHDPWPPENGDALLMPYEYYTAGPGGHLRDYWGIQPTAGSAGPTHAVQTSESQSAAQTRKRMAELTRAIGSHDDRCGATTRLQLPHWRESAAVACREAALTGLVLTDALWAEGRDEVLAKLSLSSHGPETPAVFGTPLPVLEWHELLSTSPLETTNRFIFPILIGDAVQSSVTVERTENGEWRVVSLGRSNFVDGLRKASALHGMPLEGAIAVDAEAYYQVFLWSPQSEEWKDKLIPMYHDPALDFSPGNPLPIKEVFDALFDFASSYRGPLEEEIETLEEKNLLLETEISQTRQKAAALEERKLELTAENESHAVSMREGQQELEDLEVELEQLEKFVAQRRETVSMLREMHGTLDRMEEELERETEASEGSSRGGPGASLPPDDPPPPPPPPPPLSEEVKRLAGLIDGLSQRETKEESTLR